MSRTERLETWVYVSESRLPGPGAAGCVADIVRVSRARNSDLNATGGLIFTGDRFAQFLEGPRDSILTLKASILTDRRHHRVTTIVAAPREYRQFDGWALVYSGDSQYVARFLDDVALDEPSQPRAIESAIMMIFAAFAADPQTPV